MTLMDYERIDTEEIVLVTIVLFLTTFRKSGISEENKEDKKDDAGQDVTGDDEDKNSSREDSEES